MDQDSCFGGIDPGLSGAIAAVWPGGLYVVDVPTTKVKVGKTLKRRVDKMALARLAAIVARLGITAASTEAVNGFSRRKQSKRGISPAKNDDEAGGGQSASAAFAFGHVAGQLDQALAAHGIDCKAIPPRTWKAHFGLGADKTKARELAAKLWPEHAHLFARVKDDGRAEAALIAEYTRRMYLARANQ